MTPAKTQNTAPDSAQIDLARQVTSDVLSQACGLAYYAGVMADTYPTVLQDRERLESFGLALETWRHVALDSFGRLDALVADADKILTPHGLYYDRFSSGPLTIGQRTYANAHVAAVDVGHRVLVTSRQARALLSAFTGQSPGVDDPVYYLAQRAGEVRDGAVSVLGSGYASDVSAWHSAIRIESAKAISLTPPTPVLPPIPPTSDEEKFVLDALRKHGRRLTQLKLLSAAGLGDHGTNKSLLAQMVQRGLIDNGRDKLGRGYGLPEWKTQEG